MAEFDNATLQGVGILFIVLANFACIARVWARYGQSFRWDDAWMILAYCFYMTTSIAYLVNGPLLFRYTDFLTGHGDYPGRAEDQLASRALFLFSPIGFWFTLWSVKSSLLALYKKMMIQLPLYIQLWWGVVVVCFLGLIACITTQVIICKDAGGWLTLNACSAKLSNTNLWVSYALDLSSDIMVMLLPLTLVRNLQMSFAKKISLSILFSLALFVMIAATVRAIQINQHNFQPLPTWVALWSIIEFSVAMIVGCGPGLYCKANELQQSRESSKKSGDLTDNSLQAPNPSVQPGEPVAGDVPLKRFPTTTFVKAANRSDSQEELVESSASARITIKTSFEVDRTRQ